MAAPTGPPGAPNVVAGAVGTTPGTATPRRRNACKNPHGQGVPCTSERLANGRDLSNSSRCGDPTCNNGPVTGIQEFMSLSQRVCQVITTGARGIVSTVLDPILGSFLAQAQGAVEGPTSPWGAAEVSQSHESSQSPACAGTMSTSPTTKSPPPAPFISSKRPPSWGKPVNEADEDSMAIYELPCKETCRNEEDNINRYTVGWPGQKGRPRKYLLMIGATGAGKSTLMQFIANRVMGITWDHPYRYHMVPDNVNSGHSDQAVSQTDWITAYELHAPDESPAVCDYTIIDTPGFSDTRGLDRDHRLNKQLKAFFETHWVPGLHAVCLVCQAPLARLTATQMFVFDCVTSIFGKDVEGIIFHCFTFADGQDPRARAAMKAAKIPCCKDFKFNNSALYANVQDNSNALHKFFWDIGSASVDEFLEYIAKTQPVSLELTSAVLNERDRLEVLVENLLPNVQEGLDELDTLRKTIDDIQQHAAVINANAQYQRRTIEYTWVEKTKQNGCHTTTCMECHQCCHRDCAFTDEHKMRCCAMDNNGNCTQCTGKCHWSSHKNTNYVLVREGREKIITLDDLKRRFCDAKSKKSTSEQLRDNMLKTIKRCKQAVIDNIGRMRDCKVRLREIAMSPDGMTEVEHFDVLIEAEKKNCAPGFMDRVRSLEQFRKRAEVLAQVTHSNFNPFSSYAMDTTSQQALQDAAKQQGLDLSLFNKSS